MLLVINIDDNVFDKIYKHEPVDYVTLYNSFKNSRPLSEILYQNSWEQHVNLLKEIYGE